MCINITDAQSCHEFASDLRDKMKPFINSQVDFELQFAGGTPSYCVNNSDCLRFVVLGHSNQAQGSLRLIVRAPPSDSRALHDALYSIVDLPHYVIRFTFRHLPKLQTDQNLCL